ncbi:unnamed protein product [Mesocestoides corti]|uniref:Ubiquitin carboxyl-terminal hydrolase n=1 Tax=Mesocestoides corti TaxID=53468 RepID=A0A158QRZ8_MESCO|nr:unnamed protein product [Mesocestoides corti]
MRWVPLESNPDVMTKFMRELGVKEPWCFVDVFSTDPEMQALVPCPILSLLFLYPITDNSKSIGIGTVSHEEKCFFIKQTIDNACGTVAIIHALANNIDALDITGDSPLERAELLEKEEELSEFHEDCALQGQTEAPDSSSETNLHFVAFINSDGRRDGPVLHGETSPETFLADACKVVDRFMQRDPEDVQFSLIALTKVEN